MVIAEERPTFAARVRRGWRQLTATIGQAYSARRRRKRFLRRLLDDVFVFGVLVVIVWIAINLIAHLAN
jgi:hypothetical protein